jgi:hypothetical protein
MTQSYLTDSRSKHSLSSVRVFLTAGHRNLTGGGAPGEAQLTPVYAQAYADALKRAGFAVEYIQAVDKDDNNSFYCGTLAEVASEVLRRANTHPGEQMVMLDLHMEAEHSKPGVFTIVPDDPTVPIGCGQADEDTWENNPRAVELGHALSQAIAERTGLQQRLCRELGVMSERETAIGRQGRRLTMFRVTVPVRKKLIRLLIEHGSIAKDAGILYAPETPQLCAAAVAATIRRFFVEG